MNLQSVLYEEGHSTKWQSSDTLEIHTMVDLWRGSHWQLICFFIICLENYLLCLLVFISNNMVAMVNCIKPLREYWSVLYLHPQLELSAATHFSNLKLIECCCFLLPGWMIWIVCQIVDVSLSLHWSKRSRPSDQVWILNFIFHRKFTEQFEKWKITKNTK